MMEERINYLFRKYLDNTCTKEEFDEIFSYLEQHTEAPHLQQAMQAVYTAGLHPVKPRRKIARTVFAIAATVLLLIIAGIGWQMLHMSREERTAMRSRHPVNTVTKATQRSEYKYLLLPDSTQVWLNAESSLEFPKTFKGKRREVFLNGEAYFDVKHADKVPFIIYTGLVSTEVLGTAFNIKAYPDLEKITVSVKRGKVKVNYENRQVAMLTKGEQVSIRNRDKKIREKDIREEEPTAWHEGNLLYDDYSISDILSDLERIYDVKIIINSPDIQQLRVTTSFNRQAGVENALEILCKLTDTKLKLENGTYIINHQKPN